MGLNEYHQSILKLRMEPLKRSRGVEERTATAMESAAAQLDSLIKGISRKDSIQRRLYVDRRGEIERMMWELGVDLRRSIDGEVRNTAEAVSATREMGTQSLLDENGVNLLADFSRVPQNTVEVLAQRGDVEGLKLSPRIWAETNAAPILADIEAAIVRGSSANELALGLRRYVIGADSLAPEQLADLRTLRGGLRSVGTSIKAKAMRLARTEINNSYWEASRLSAQESPVVKGIEWNLSGRHPEWDVCDILAGQDLYGLGKGTYPPEALPPKPHPNDLCFMTDKLRSPEEWDTPRPVPRLDVDPDALPDRPNKAVGTDHHIKTQRGLAIELIKRANQGGQGPLVAEFGSVLIGAMEDPGEVLEHLNHRVDSLLQLMKDEGASIVLLDPKRQSERGVIETLNEAGRNDQARAVMRNPHLTDEFIQRHGGFASAAPADGGPALSLTVAQMSKGFPKNEVTHSLFKKRHFSVIDAVSEDNRPAGSTRTRTGANTQGEAVSIIYHELGHSVHQTITKRSGLLWEALKVDETEMLRRLAGEYGKDSLGEVYDSFEKNKADGAEYGKLDKKVAKISDSIKDTFDKSPEERWLKLAERKIRRPITRYMRKEWEIPSEAMGAYMQANADMKKNAPIDYKLIKDAQKILGVTFTPHGDN